MRLRHTSCNVVRAGFHNACFVATRAGRLLLLIECRLTGSLSYLAELICRLPGRDELAGQARCIALYATRLCTFELKPTRCMQESAVSGQLDEASFSSPRSDALECSSFDNKEFNVIQFFHPLTVIVGHNGSGKTVRAESGSFDMRR